MKKKNQNLTSLAPRPFGKRDLIGYAAGDLGCNLSFSLVSNYIFFFYTQFIGITEVEWSVIILILKVWDAINDPLMGSIIDSKRISDKSKFKPWIRIGSIGLIVSTSICFLPITGAAHAVKIAVCMLSYFAWDLCYTLVNVPYGAMSAAITDVPSQRTALSAWRSIGAAAGGAVCMLLPLIIHDKNDDIIGERFLPIALVMGIAALGAYEMTIRMTVERIHVPASAEKFSMREALRGFAGNRPLIGLGIASFALIVFFNSTLITNEIVFQSYFHNTKFLTLASFGAYLPMVLAVFLAGPLCRRFGKRLSSGAPFLISVVACVITLLLPIGEGGSLLWVICLAVINSGSGIFNMTVWAMVSDCVDYQQLKTGKRYEGSVYAVYSFFRKLAQGVGSSLVALCLRGVGYNSTLGAAQDAQVALSVKNLALVLVLIGAAAVFAATVFIYNIKKSDEEYMHDTLGLEKNSLDVNEAIENRND